MTTTQMRQLAYRESHKQARHLPRYIGREIDVQAAGDYAYANLKKVIDDADDFSHIDNPPAYVRSVARSLLREFAAIN